MSVTQIVVAGPAGETIFKDTAMGATADNVKASATLLLYAIIDNSANAAAATYVKLYNTGTVSVGTTAPDEIIYVPGSAVVTKLFFTGALPGVTFGTALSAAALTAGGTAGTTPPVSSVVVTFGYV